MNNRLSELCDIDHKIEHLLAEDDLDAEEIMNLVDKRDQILQGLIAYASNNSQFASSSEWRDAIANTQLIVEQMEKRTAGLGDLLRRFRHGNRSVQQYKKFL